MATSVTSQQILNEVKKFLGIPYVWGGTTPSGFDCSGLMEYSYAQLGISIPRTSEEQYTFTKRITQSQLQPGDLVFSEMRSDGPGHVGMYIGNNSVIEAAHPGTNVRVTPLAYFAPVAFGRIPSLVPGAVTGVPSTGSTGTGAGGGTGGNSLFSFPSEITGFFSTAINDLAATGAFFDAFFEPSTYVRIGSGVFGLAFLVAGLVFMLRAAEGL